MAILGPLASIIGGIMGRNAASATAAAGTRTADKQLEFSKEIYGDQKNAFSDWLKEGKFGAQAYNSLLGLGAAPAGFEGFQKSPGYQFQLDQGLDATKSAAAAHGGIGSGATMTALNNFAQGVANQDYQTYLNRLQGISQQGQAAAGGQAQAAGQYGANGLSAMGSRGDAQAAGIMGGYNALAGGINGAISGFGYMQGSGGGGGLNGMFKPGGIFAPTQGGRPPYYPPGGASGQPRG